MTEHHTKLALFKKVPYNCGSSLLLAGYSGFTWGLAMVWDTGNDVAALINLLILVNETSGR